MVDFLISNLSWTLLSSKVSTKIRRRILTKNYESFEYFNFIIIIIIFIFYQARTFLHQICDEGFLLFSFAVKVDRHPVYSWICLFLSKFIPFLRIVLHFLVVKLIFYKLQAYFVKNRWAIVDTIQLIQPFWYIL